MNIRLIFGAAVFAAALAACSSSTGSASPASHTSGTTKTAHNARFGSILVDAHGATLYTLTSNGKAVPCTSPACVATWPPLSSGGHAVTHAGLPLYRYAGDSAPGAATGDGIVSFGGVWRVVQLSNASAMSPAPKPATPAPPASGGGAYGY
jgi:predicted lipoprotein with Yx(FWY)xxD motif